MKTKIFLLFITLFTLSTRAQSNLEDNILICDQYSKIINFITKDSCAKTEFPVKKFKIHIDNKVGYGIGCPFMIRFYLAETLQINLNNLNVKDSTIQELWKKLEKEEYENRIQNSTSKCLEASNSKIKNNNVYLRFARKNENVVFVNASRIYNRPRHTNGIFYLFFFDDNNNIRQVYRSNWIE